MQESNKELYNSNNRFCDIKKDVYKFIRWQRYILRLIYKWKVYNISIIYYHKNEKKSIPKNKIGVKFYGK